MNTNSNISIFNNENFGEIRVVKQGGEPWFVAKDVAVALGYRLPQKAIIDHCKGGSKTELPSKGGQQQMTIIPEADLYRLILRSKLPQAEAFQDWVVEEVLPAIRKDGAYVYADEKDTEIEVLARGMLAAGSAIERLKKQVATLEPKAEHYDRYIDVGRDESVGTFAKNAKDAGVDVGIDELFHVFRFKKVLCSGKGVNWNQPYANYVKAGLMTTRPVPPQKRKEWACTPLVTTKGKEYFLSRLAEWVCEYRAHRAEQDYIAQLCNDSTKETHALN